MATNKFIKKERTFTFIRRWGWIMTILIAIGGLWFPKLGLIVPFIMLALMGMSLFKGKYWCGNFCFHGSLFDRLILPISQNKKIPDILKSKGVVTLVFVIFMLGITNRMITAFSYFGTADFLDQLGFVFVFTYLVVTIVGSILGIIINPRTWCSFCPMGTIQAVFYKIGKAIGTAGLSDEMITMNRDKCKQCNLCSKVCPVQLEPYPTLMDKDYLDSEECIKCSTCVKNCPVGALSLEKVDKNK